MTFPSSRPSIDLRLSPTPPAQGGTVAASDSDGALTAIDEMLERLASVTDAGRQHLMSKIVAVLVAHPLAASVPLFPTRVDDLRREAGKTVPDGDAFSRVARPLVATLAQARRASR